MNKALLLALCLAVGIFTALAGFTLKGKIVDEAGLPLEGAVISDGQKQVFSAADGSFQIATQADSLLIQRLSFRPRRIATADISGTIILQPEPVVLPRIVVSESSLDFFSGTADLIRLPVDPDRHYYSTGEILSGSSALRSADIRLKGESQAISILGNLARHSLILLDGVALNPNGSNYDLSLLDPQNIASIEVVKNNASVYGGGSAIGGIVQITTKKGNQVSGQEGVLDLEFGSFGYAKSAFTFRTTSPSWNLRLNLSDLSTDNDFSYQLRSWWAPDSTARRENNAKQQRSFSAAGSLRTQKLLMALQTDYTAFHRQLPGTVNFLEVYRNAWLEGFANRSKLSLEARPWGLDWQAQLWLNLDKTLYDNTRAPLPVFISKTRQNMLNLALRNTLGHEHEISPSFSLNGNLSTEAGSNHYQSLDLLSSAADLDHSVRFANASLRAGSKLLKGTFTWMSSAAVRYDRTAEEDDLSWRLESSLRQQGWLEATLGGTLGTSFALPSPYDLYWKGDSQALGNPELKSERSRGWQLWLSGRKGLLGLKAAWHHNSIANLIQWRQVQMNGNVWKPLNIGRARIQNLELEGDLAPCDWLSLSASALRTWALDLSQLPPSSALELMYTPRLSYSLGLDLAWKKLGAWAKYSFTGEQWTTPDNLAEPLAAYALLDLGIRASFPLLGFTLSPHLSVLNILDKRYEVYTYVPQPGISFYGGLSLQVSGSPVLTGRSPGYSRF